MKTSAVLVFLSLGCSGLFASGCSEKLSGPTPAVTDAVKQNTSDHNPRIMWNQAATSVTITGARFTPVATNTLSDKPGVKLPQFYLVNATSSTRLAKPVWFKRSTMTATIPAGIAIADAKGWEDFQIVAEDPAGIRGKPGASFRVSIFEPPVIGSTEINGKPAVARFCDSASSSTAPFILTILGAKFMAGVKVEFAAAATGVSSFAGAATVSSVSDAVIISHVPAGLAAGDYDVRVTNVDGQIFVLKKGFRIEFYTCPITATITGVFPRFAWRAEDVMIQVDGIGFKPTPKIIMRRPQYAFATSYTTYFTTTTVQSLIFRDSTRQEGWYDIHLRNPYDSTGATFVKAVLVLASPPPRIDNVTPDTLPGTDPVVLITGDHFPAGATVAIYNPIDGFVMAITQSVAATTRMYAELPGSTAPHGAYVLRVYADMLINGVIEKVYGEYSNIVIVGPSGNTDGFKSANSKLVTPRRDFGLAGARNGIGSRFLYAVGGRSSSAASAAGLASVEIASIDIFGNLGTFYSNQTTLGVGRYGLGLVQHEGWLYALGGSTATGITTAVLKAKVLDPGDAPQIVSAVTSPTGSLAFGSWIYQISAVMAPGDSVNPGGESLPSIEVGVSLDAGGSLTLTFKPVAGAASYRIYRTASAFDAGLTERLLATRTAIQLSCGTTCAFTDSGSWGSVSAVKPLAPGSLSAWTSGGSLEVPRAFFAAALARNAAGAAYVYALGGVSTATGSATVLNSYEHASITGGASVNLVVDAGNTMNSARRDSGVAVATANTVNAATLGGTGADWVSLVGGTSSTADYGANLLNFASNAQVQADGKLGAFTNSYSPKQTQAIAGGAAVITSNVLFQFGGASSFSGAGSTQQVFSGILQSSMGLGAYSNNGGAKLVCNDSTTSCPRSFYGSTRFNGQIFMVGGVRDTGVLAVTDSIISVFY